MQVEVQYYGTETELLRALLYPGLHTIIPQSSLEKSLRALLTFQEGFRFNNIETECTSGGLAHELTPIGMPLESPNPEQAILERT
jgi:hypothetical protein